MHQPRFLTAALLLLLFSTSAPATILLPGGEVRDVSFERHVVPLLGKLGCNAGACHGSFQGKGGLRLSLFGSEPDRDYLALTRHGLARRIDPGQPDRSLILQKATGEVPHGGGKRLRRGSWMHAVLSEWIATGARGQAGSGRLRALQVYPAEQVFRRVGEGSPLRVEATYADGTTADVTRFCEFRVKDEAIAEALPDGTIRAIAFGEARIIVSYKGDIAVARALVPAANDLPRLHVPAANLIDEEVFAKLRRLRVPPSELCDDSDFLRRVTIDSIGSLPSPADVRAFLNDKEPDKRTRKVQELLRHPRHASLWALRLCDVTSCNVDALDGPAELHGKRAQLWHDWFRRRIADNVSWDRIAHGVLCATSREGNDVLTWLRQEGKRDQTMRQGHDNSYAERPTLDLFWRRGIGEDFFPLEQMAELTATAFLGVRLECAQCHKHPFDHWTQADYRAYANVFAQLEHGASIETTAALADYLEARRRAPSKAGPALPRVQEVYLRTDRLRRLPDPETGSVLPARAPGGPLITYDGDAREALFRWLVQPDNRFFARALVNRTWAHYFGAGLVEPVDAFSAANPPTNERLLDALAKDFITHGFDLRRLEHLILTSRTYQLSSRPSPANASDHTHHSHAHLRPMLAEVVVDVLSDALGVPEPLGGDVRPGARAIDLASNRVYQPHLARTFTVFGRPARAATCDCERPHGPALPQTLFLMTDSVLLKRIREGRLARLLADKRSDSEIIEELCLATLSRYPQAAEMEAAMNQVRRARDRASGLADIFWALLNTREFILNH
jgi:hypothetical protein